MWGILTPDWNHISSAYKFEGQRWRVRYIENKIFKTQATLLTLIFLIPGATTFTTFNQVSSSIYSNFFGITQDPSINLYLVTKLVPLSLGCNIFPFYRHFNQPFTPTALPIHRNVIEILDSIQSLAWKGLSLPPIIFNLPLLQSKDVSSKLIWK